MGEVQAVFHVIVHHAEEGGLWGEVVELPGCMSQGESFDELLKNVQEAIGDVVRSYIEDGEKLPESAETVATVEVALPA